jgi:hypothetical protein
MKHDIEEGGEKLDEKLVRCIKGVICGALNGAALVGALGRLASDKSYEVFLCAAWGLVGGAVIGGLLSAVKRVDVADALDGCKQGTRFMGAALCTALDDCAIRSMAGALLGGALGAGLGWSTQADATLAGAALGLMLGAALGVK